MGIGIKAIAFGAGLCFLALVLISVRRNTMRPAFAVLWLAISFFLLSISIFEPLYKQIATNLGIEDARHVIYGILIGFLLTYVFYLSLRISPMADRIQILLTQVAILEHELKAGPTASSTSSKSKQQPDVHKT